MIRAAQFLGVAAALSAAALWLVFVFANPYGTISLSPGSRGLAWAMIALAAGGAAAAVKVKPYWMIGVFLASFLPAGLYLLATPGLFRWIGAADAMLAAAAALMLGARRGGSSRKLSSEAAPQ